MKLGMSIAGFAAIAAIGGAAAAQHPPVESVTVQGSSVVKTTLDALTVAGGDYTVRRGDTLASIAGREYGNARCWPGIWAANSGFALLVEKLLRLHVKRRAMEKARDYLGFVVF